MASGVLNFRMTLLGHLSVQIRSMGWPNANREHVTR